MDAPKLNILRKELLNIPPSELVNYLIRIARFKTENKELLHYLIFYNEHNESYIVDIKNMIAEFYRNLPASDYAKTKSLRKLTRVMNKHIKFISDKNHEVDICCYFCSLFIENKTVKTSHKPLLNLLYRQLKRINKLIPKLEEDLQFDFSREFDELIAQLKQYKPYFDLNDLK